MALDSFANHRQLRPAFGGAASSRIQRIEEAVDRLWRFCENLSGEDGISVRETAEGGAAIGGGGGGSGGVGGLFYDGYFALSFDAEDPAVFNVRGGIALVNGIAASVDDHQYGWPYTIDHPEQVTEGHLWLYAYVRATGSQSEPFGVGAELLFCDAALDNDASTHPTATGIVASSRKLIATVWGWRNPEGIGRRGNWRQEFITGSECNFLLLGDACE